MNMILFPSSCFSDNRADEELEAEYHAAVQTGLFDIALFSNEKWFNEGILKLNKQIDAPTAAVYRRDMRQGVSDVKKIRHPHQRVQSVLYRRQDSISFEKLGAAYPCPNAAP